MGQKIHIDRNIYINFQMLWVLFFIPKMKMELSACE